jgi:small redox-active disulfide protein 2
MLKIEVLGSGCANCQRLEALAVAAVEKLNADAEVLHVTDLREIMARGVMATPGLVVDDKVVSSGRVPSPSEVEALISKALGI